MSIKMRASFANQNGSNVEMELYVREARHDAAIASGPATQAGAAAVNNIVSSGTSATLALGSGGGGGRGFTTLSGVGGSVVSGSGVTSALSSDSLALAGLSGHSVDFGKLQLGLSQLYVAAQTQANAAGPEGRAAALQAFTVDSPYVTVGGGYVAIDAAAKDGNGAALLAKMEELGLMRGASFGAMVSGLVPLDALDELAGLASLKFARPSLVDFHTGSVLSQDDHAMGTDGVRASLGLTGAGITIGVLSDSFNTATQRAAGGALTIHYADDITSGDLPAGIVVLQDGSPTGDFDEGRAMIQQMYDVVPGASFAFATANGGEANFANNIINLRNVANSDIIVDDVRYLAEPMFQDGIIAQAVNQVVADGAVYFSSAGNYSDNSYESVFRDSGQTITLTPFFHPGTGPQTYILHDFDPGAGVDIGQHLTIPSGTLIAQWDDPFFSHSPASGGADSDLTLIIWYDNNNNDIADAGDSFYDLDNFDNIGDDPVEGFSDSNDDFKLMIGVRVTGSVATTDLPGLVKYVGFDTVNILEWDTASGTNYGHSNSEGAISVAAADWYQTPGFGQTPPLLESFSSKGGVAILFDEDGVRLASPELRAKTEITAPDGGNTTFFVSDTIRDADTSPNFYGTSSAAPNAAALAALMMQARPTLTRDEILSAMQHSAIDITGIKDPAAATLSHASIPIPGGGIGFDAYAGAGLVNATGALAAISVQLFDETNQLVGSFFTIQAAINAAHTGYTIVAPPGTFVENLTVDEDVTIRGANEGQPYDDPARDPETVIDGSINVTANGVTIDGVSVTGVGLFGSINAGIYVSGDNFTLINTILDGPDLGGNSYGVATEQTLNLEVRENLFEGYAVGILVSSGDSTGAIHDNRFQGDGGPFTGLGNGIQSETSLVDINDNAFDGIYAGVVNLSPFGPTDTVDIDDFVFDNTYTNNAGARPLQLYPTVETHHIIGSDISEAFSGDLGEFFAGVPLGPLTFDGNGGNDRAFGGASGDLFNGGEGDDGFEGKGGDDQLNGGNGFDFASYVGDVSDYTIVYEFDSNNNVIGFLEVTDNNTTDPSGIDPGGLPYASDEGHDTLSSIEALFFGNNTVIDPLNDDVLLFNASDNLVGTFDNIQDAIDAASDGYRIFAKPGTYTENLTVDKDVTIQGNNHGVPGDDGSRGAETILDGSIHVTAAGAGATVDGLEITGTSVQGGFDVAVNVDALANDFSLLNSVLSGVDSVTPPAPTFAVLTGNVTGLDISDNLFEGYAIGAYISGNDTSGTVNDNLFQGDGAGSGSGVQEGIFLETSHVILDGNTFDGIDGGAIFVNPHGPDVVDLRTIILNTIISDSGVDRPVQVLASTLSTDITGTDFNEAMYDPLFGTAGEIIDNLRFDGQGGDDHIFGNSLADTLLGGSGIDEIYGGAGDDSLTGGLDNDLLDGEGDVDTAHFADTVVTFIDTPAGWTITSSEGSDFLRNVEIVEEGAGQRNLLVRSTGFASLQDALDAAEDGDNVRLAAGSYSGSVFYSDADLSVIAQAGAVQSSIAYFSSAGQGITVVAAGGNDTIFTFEGGDILNGGGGSDYLSSGADGDFIDGGTGNDTADGGAGADILFGGDGNDNLLGGADGDYMNGGIGGDYAEGGTGNDAFEGGDGNDIAFGGDGDDNLLGDGGDDYLNGGTGANYLDGGAGNDRLDGGSDGDILLGGADNDVIVAGDGADHAEGGTGNDTLFGEGGEDDLIGQEGNDYLDGGDGDDYLDGGDGDDGLSGGAGSDRLFGGDGADTYHFASALGATNVDAVDGFVSGSDKLALDDAVFTGLTPGALNPNAFVIGTSAQDADDRIIYDSATGALYFDADGNGSGSTAVQFATLEGAPSLVASDIIVF